MLPSYYPSGHTRAFIRILMPSACFALICLTGSPTHAIDYAARDVGDWTVAASKDGQGCFLTRTYDRAGDTTLLLGLDADGANHLSVLNANWSIKPKDRLKLDFRLSNGGYAKHAAIGLRSDGKQGFVTSFEAKFPAYFARSNELHIARGDVPVERLNLAGSGAAVAELRRCVAAQRLEAKAAKARKPRGDDIPEDPFAPSAPRRSKK
ncbi:hypothetical protein [Sphingomonas carotinifaciens]|uniref:Uncharacterized protein n=2 Tax=Sphingomonas carotinifaciens TaxID=1166323 RepID=A0A1G7P4B1_9SPHN|nr:hypothetical protein [Sphingomonas carotinifaciens]SDF81061.1 hypothetical protein SAMN05216557_10655 [Sphingomonas carotinifaciens]